MIKISSLSRSYGDFLAVDSVSFEIEQGQIVGLLGHNGAGKTTIMKMLTGYLESNSGEIKINDLDIGSNKLEIQKQIGYLPENVPLYPEMTVADYLEYVASLRSLENSNEAIKLAIKRTSLEEKVQDRIETLSKGYKQRVGVAQAILTNPRILILDEPTNGLDPSQIEEMRTLIKELGKNSTVIISTHIMQEVEAICDRVIILNRGKIAVDSSLEDLKSSNKVLLSTDSNEVDSILLEVDGVSGVSKTKSGEKCLYSIEISKESSLVIPKIANKIIQNNNQLYSLTLEVDSLENIFRQVNN